MSVYVPSTAAEREAMRREAGIASVDQLFACIPPDLRLQELPDVPPALAEQALMRRMKELAGRNTVAAERPCFLGAGAYDHYIPAPVRHLVGRQEFYTAYTPYQPEISQGTLQAIFEFQTYIVRLTGLDVANASMYDGASAAAEAALMALRATARPFVLVSEAVSPQYRDTIATYIEAEGYEMRLFGIGPDGTAAGQLPDELGVPAAIIAASPNFHGIVEDLSTLAQKAHAAGALMVAICDPLSLALLKSPGSCGVDIAVGETQPLGMPLSFGGPYAGYLAATQALLRRLPGRIVGETVDRQGRRTFVLTIQAREQHIRREKATSNICTNQALCALTATIYLSLMGKTGLIDAAEQSARKAAYLSRRLVDSGLGNLLYTGPFFREFSIRLNLPDKDVGRLNRYLDRHGITGGYDLAECNLDLAGCCLFAVTEKRTAAEIDQLVEQIAAYVHAEGGVGA